MADPAARFVHLPVMVDEVLDAFARIPDGPVVDATVGGAGHAAAILTQRPHVSLHGFDQDPLALRAASERLAEYGDRAVLHAARFDTCRHRLAALSIDVISGFLMDLGVSSPQLDQGDRGFSYRVDGPLDMRMDPTRPRSAATVVNEYPLEELIDVLRSYGDERHSARIARAIVAARPIGSTVELAEIVKSAVPAAARRHGGHPATRSFQAIRIEVNEELAILGQSIDDLISMLSPGGVGVILTYHSGEDRIAKDRLRNAVEAHDLPGMPLSSEFEWLHRGAVTPGRDELEKNPRARSARLRAIVRKEVTE